MDTSKLKVLIDELVMIVNLGDQVTHGFEFSEIALGFKIVTSAPSVLSSASEALAEYKALDEAGRADVNAFIQSEVVGFQDAFVGVGLGQVLTFLISLTAVISMFQGKAAAMKVVEEVKSLAPQVEL